MALFRVRRSLPPGRYHGAVLRLTALAISALFVFTIAAAPLPAQTKDDTSHLAAHLRNLRGRKALSAAQYEKFQAEYLDWIDRRVTAGATIASINRELAAARLFGTSNPAADEFNRSDAGLLEPLQERRVRGADDLFVIDAVVPAGDYCSADATAIVYQRRPIRRLGWINAQPLKGHGYELTGIAAGEETDGTRVVATGWSLFNCTGAWGSKIARIDRLSAGPAANILTRNLHAYISRSELLAPWIRGDIVTFLYEGGSFIEEVFSTPAIARYQLTEEKVRRENPLALTVAGFIQEWMALSGPDAARWSAPEALTVLPTIAAEAKTGVAELSRIARCAGAPPVWEIAVTFNNSKHFRVFRVEGDRATTLRLLEVASAASPQCASLGPNGIGAIRQELPW